jgi:hypothetical protein
VPSKAIAAAAASSKAAPLAAASTAAQAVTYDEQAHLNVEGNASLAGVPYYLETSDGRTFTGHADDQGLLPRIDTPNEGEYSVFWGDEALVKMGGNQ